MLRRWGTRAVFLALLIVPFALVGLRSGDAAAQSSGSPIGIGLEVSQIPAGQTGTATARFNRIILACSAVIAVRFCVDPTTGQPIVFNAGSVLNGNVLFTIADSTVATWVNAQPTATTPVPSSTAGFVTTASQTIVRCGFFPTTSFPSSGGAGTFGPLSGFFGGCESASAQFRALRPGVTNVTATFIPDLPGAFGTPLAGLPANVAALVGLFAGSTFPSDTKVLEVVAAAPSGVVQLVRGCNNVTPTVTESAAAYAARVTPQAALVAIWEHQAATNTFRGFSPQAGAPNDLAQVTRLRPVFVCVSAAATLDQPAV